MLAKILNKDLGSEAGLPMILNTSMKIIIRKCCLAKVLLEFKEDHPWEISTGLLSQVSKFNDRNWKSKPFFLSDFYVKSLLSVPKFVFLAILEIDFGGFCNFTDFKSCQHWFHEKSEYRRSVKISHNVEISAIYCHSLFTLKSILENLESLNNISCNL